MNDAADEEQGIGYRRPPASTRFRKGQSGNPRGRPRGRRNEPPYEAVLGQTVTIREDGIERRVTAAEAFLLHVTKRGLEGDGAAARATMAAIEAARLTRLERGRQVRYVFVTHYERPGSVTDALEPLRIGRKLDPYRETVRLVLEPWIVEAALARLGDRRLTPTEQEAVVRATRTPGKVHWPDWWTAGPVPTQDTAVEGSSKRQHPEQPADRSDIKPVQKTAV
jgi:hypothetical protein